MTDINIIILFGNVLFICFNYAALVTIVVINRREKEFSEAGKLDREKLISFANAIDKKVGPE